MKYVRMIGSEALVGHKRLTSIDALYTHTGYHTLPVAWPVGHYIFMRLQNLNAGVFKKTKYTDIPSGNLTSLLKTSIFIGKSSLKKWVIFHGYYGSHWQDVLPPGYDLDLLGFLLDPGQFLFSWTLNLARIEGREMHPVMHRSPWHHVSSATGSDYHISITIH